MIFDLLEIYFESQILTLFDDQSVSGWIHKVQWFPLSQGRRKVWKSKGALSTVVGIICPQVEIGLAIWPKTGPHLQQPWSMFGFGQ